MERSILWWSKKRIVWFVLMIITMAVIYFFSDQNGEASEKVSNTVVNAMKTTLSRPQSLKSILLGVSIRKWAHVGLFGILGLTIYEWIESVPKAALICLGYSIVDEVHQCFIPGREAKATDIFVDAIGFLAMIALLEMVKTFRSRSNKK